MQISRFALHHRPLVILAVIATGVMGVRTFMTMSRREDPEILIRTCLIATQWPGATTENVETLVTDVIEEAVSGIEEVGTLKSRSRVGISTISVDLDESITEVDQVWDKIRAKVAEIESRLPQGCQRPLVNANFGDVSAICLALYQTPPPGRDAIERPYTWRELEVIGKRVKEDLRRIDLVAEVTLYGTQDEVITLEVDGSDWAQIGVTKSDLASAFDGRNIVAPGGSLNTSTTRYSVRPTGEFAATSEFDQIVVQREDGAPSVRLGDIPVNIVRSYADPMRMKHRLLTPEIRAEKCIVLGLTMKGGSNIVEMGEAVDAAIDRMKGMTLEPDIELTRINDLPRQVSTLISDFMTNLWQAIAIVLAVAFFMVGWRAAFIMAAAVPLCMVSCFAVVQMFGVELEQFSIASLIIALGMIVDNAIVVSDNTLAQLRSGKSRMQAAIDGAQSLAVPVLTSTLTTVAAFAPLLTIPGGGGEYMRSLPIVVATTLLISWIVAMTVTPLLCFWLLKAPSEPVKKAKPSRFIAGYTGLVRWCMGHKAVTLGVAGLALVGSTLLLPAIGSQYFPAGLRDQFFIDVWLPEGTPISETERVCRDVEDLILQTRIDAEGVDRLAHATCFVGTGGPRMMLTSSPKRDNPHYALVLVNTTDATKTADWVREIAPLVEGIPGARVVARQFVLGPPLDNPVEYVLQGEDAAVLRATAADMVDALREVPGAVDVHHDWGNSGYRLDVEIDNAAADLAQVTNRGVAESLNDLLSGGYLTTYREGDHQVQVLLRVRRDQRTSMFDFDGASVNGAAGKVPLRSVASITPKRQAALIRRLNGRRAITIQSRVADGYLATSVATAVQPALERIAATLPAGYELLQRGEIYEASKGSGDIGFALQLSLVLILVVLVAQYNSFLKPLVILSAIPLALIGALLGLFVSGWPLGFMPSLGIVALAGVVINNAIILIDFIESTMRDGAELRDAVATAGAARLRPILLTTFTTVGGLIPLALFGGPMWAGMAYAMMFGLLVSTLLTLLVIPTIYVVFVEKFGMVSVPEENS